MEQTLPREFERRLAVMLPKSTKAQEHIMPIPIGSAIGKEGTMFSKLLDHITELQVDQSELLQPHSYDEKDSIVSLDRWIDQEAPRDVKLAFNRLSMPPHFPHIRSVVELDNEHLKGLTVEVLTHADQTELVAIVGAGTYSYPQLVDEVLEGTAIGQQMVQSVRQHSIFMEEAIKTGKVRPKDEQSPAIPDFEF